MTEAVPTPAATIVLLRGSIEPEVFLLLRHARSGFMANAYVFPGGRVDEADGSPGLVDRLEGMVLAALVERMEGVTTETEALAHVAAAVRETFEEAGVLLARRRGGDWLDPGDEVVRERLDGWRAGLNDRTVTLADLLDAEDLVIAGEALHYFAHWITPRSEPRRFDTRFFLAACPAGQEPRHDARETTDSRWSTPAAALEAHAQRRLMIPPPTWRVLGDLASRGPLTALQGWADGLSRVPVIAPHPTTDGQTFVLALPGDPLYPGADADAARRRIVLRDGCWQES